MDCARRRGVVALALSITIVAFWSALVYFTVFEPNERSAITIVDEYVQEGDDPRRALAVIQAGRIESGVLWVTGVVVTLTGFVAAYLRTSHQSGRAARSAK